MAERRMFAKTIIDSDAFLDMPLSAQALYFHLSMRADDDGFVNNPKKIQRLTNASDDDIKLLILKSFLIPFDNGIVVIKHWRIHNYIRADRKHDTKYQDEIAMLGIKENGSYTLCQTNVSQLVDKRDTEVRLGKDSIDKINKDILSSKNETCKEIIDYLNEKTNKKFRPNSAATKRHLNARLDEGYKVEDFKKVIDVKCQQWIDDVKMKAYLRPETLFSATHFESYLNEYTDKPKSKYSDAIERMNKHMEEKQKETEDIDMGDFY